jgi:AcrR family transcriptional regulator
MPVSKGESIDLERTRGKVLQAATELFYRDGTHAGINELTERAGISKLTLYRHFGSKEGLLEQVLRQRSDRVVAWLKATAEAPEDPVERVLAVFDALRAWYAEQGFRGCAIVNAATESPTAATREVARMHLGRHRELLTALARDTGTPDPELAGRQLLILLEGATVVSALGGDPDSASDARALAETLLRAP